jgi:DNA-binding GntR family transcriptional regulator
MAAADLAEQINSGSLPAWHELPVMSELTRKYDVSPRTVSKVKTILANHGLLQMECRRYVVAPQESDA